MSLEKNLEIKSQQLAEKKQAEVKTTEEKKFSSFRKEISDLESKKNKINTSFDNLQELAGLQQNEVKDYLKTKKVIEGILEKHRETLVEEGIKDKKGIISAYPKEDEVKAHKQTHQELKTTARKILKERDNLKKQGIENVRGKEFKPEIEKKASEFDEKIKELKLQTPEGQGERKEEFKKKIEEILKTRTNWRFGIDKTIFPYKSCLDEAKKYGKGGEEIVRQEIEATALKHVRWQFEENLRREGFESLATEDVLEDIENHVKSKIDYEWLETKREIFESDVDFSYHRIKDEGSRITIRQKKVEQALNKLDNLQNELKNRLGEKVKTEEKILTRSALSNSKKPVNIFYSPEGRKIEEDLRKAVDEKNIHLKGIDEQIKKKEQEGSGAFGVRGRKNKVIINNLEVQKEKIEKERNEFGKRWGEQHDKEEGQLGTLNGIIKELVFEEISLTGTEFASKEGTLKEAFEKVKNILQEVRKESLSPEKQKILQEYEELELKTKKAKETYENIKNQNPRYLDFFEK